jgi:transcriptional regulator with XRE-family HTH domain
MKTSKIEFDRIEVDGGIGNYAQLDGIAELDEDIKANGNRVPMIVWHKHLSGGSAHTLADGRKVYDRYFLLDGWRRHAAITKLRTAGEKDFDEVTVVLFHCSEDDARLAQISANLARRSPSVLDTAEAIHNLRLRGVSTQTIATRIGKSSTWVTNILKVRDNASPQLKAALRAGEVPLAAAMVIAALPEAEQAAKLVEAAAAPERERTRVAKGETKKPSKRPGAKKIQFAVDYFEAHSGKQAQIVAAALKWVQGGGWNTEALGDKPSFPRKG